MDEAEIRSKYESGQLGKVCTVAVSCRPPCSPRSLTAAPRLAQLLVEQLKVWPTTAGDLPSAAIEPASHSHRCDCTWLGPASMQTWMIGRRQLADRLVLLQTFLKSKSESTSGKKAELVERIGEWLDSHAA